MGHALGNNYGKFYSFLSKPVALDLNFVVDSANGNGLGVRSVKGQGVENVFMFTSQTPGKGPNGALNPNPAAGFALIQLAYNYARAYAGPLNIISPLSGSNLAINATALTVGNPYVITSVGHGSPGTGTIVTVADSSGSLAGKYFNVFDSYGNNWLIWIYVTGVGGSAPAGVAGIPIQVTIAENDTNATVATDIAAVMALLPSNQYAGTTAFASATVSGHTITYVANNNIPLNGVAQDGAGSLASGFTFALTKYLTNLQDWQLVGVPPGVVPAVGVSFIATSQGNATHGTSTGLVQAPSVSGIISTEIVGDPNGSIGPIPMGGSPNVGSWLMIQFLAPTVSGSAYDTPMIPTAPADNTVISMTLLLEQAARVGGNNE